MIRLDSVSRNALQAKWSVRDALRWLGSLLLLVCLCQPLAAQKTLDQVVDHVQPKIVKIYGAGGIKRLEAYQSGILISENGIVLTVWSYVLDVDPIVVVLADGRRFEAKLKGYDPRLEIALLDINAIEMEHFNLDQVATLEVGQRILAFSNLFGIATGQEQASVLQGRLSAKSNLEARRGAFESIYTGPIYAVDAIVNNPGSAGGALTDGRGNLAGLLGKELRNSHYNTWMNYAIPMSELRSSIDEILSGRFSPRSIDEQARRPVDPMTLELLGIVLVPDVLPSTPPFIDRVEADSAADAQQLKSDDLILFVNDRVMRSCAEVIDEISYVERDREVSLTVRRGNELKTVLLKIR
jgi:serine protease Do